MYTVWKDELLLLMVQKSGDHQLRLVVVLSLFPRFEHHPRWLFGISEPSTVCSEHIEHEFTGDTWVRGVEFDVGFFLEIPGDT